MLMTSFLRKHTSGYYRGYPEDADVILDRIKSMPPPRAAFYKEYFDLVVRYVKDTPELIPSWVCIAGFLGVDMNEDDGELDPLQRRRRT